MTFFQYVPDFLVPLLSGQEFAVVPRGDGLWLLQRLQCLHHPMLPRLMLVQIRQHPPFGMAVRRLIVDDEQHDVMSTSRVEDYARAV